MNVEKHTPDIRFEGFSTDWTSLTLGDLGTVAMNKRIFKHQTTMTGEVPFFKIGTFGKQPDAFISKTLFDEYKKKYLYPITGDLLLSASGSIGRVVEYKGEEQYFQDSNIVWLKHDGRIDNAFLKVFYSMVKWSGLEGSTIKRLYNKNILDTEICTPERSEQIKIGNYFQKLDNLINQHQQKHDKLSNIKKAMLEKMFPKQGKTIPEIRFKGFSGEWEEKELGDSSIEILAGGDIDKEKISIFGKYPVLANALTNDGILGYYRNEFRVKAPAVTVTGRGDVGHAKARFTDFTPVVRLLTIKTKHNVYFLENAINNHPVMVESTGVPQLTVPQLSKYKILFPTLDEQTYIGNYFQKLDTVINQHQQQITKLNNIKQACLSKMFV